MGWPRKRMGWLRWAWLLLVPAVFLGPHGSPAWAQTESELQRFVAGLRQRRLYDLAVLHLKQMQGKGTLQQQAEAAVELARTRAEQAVHLPAAKRGPLWDQATAALHDFRQQHASHPRRLLIDLQEALVWLARGELARQEALLSGNQADRLQQARAHLREATRRLEDLQEEVAGELRLAFRRTGEDGEQLSTKELEALERHVGFQLARAFRNQGLCYPPDSADRANSLVLAQRRLQQIAELAVADELVWDSRVAEVICLRLLDDHKRATERLSRWAQDRAPAPYSHRLRAEGIRLLLQQGRWSDAEKVAAQDPRAGKSPQLDLARLEFSLARLEQAQSDQHKQAVKKWQSRAEQQVRQIERQWGPYWMRRAETLLAGAISAGDGGSVEALRRAAASFYRSGQIDKAVAAYDRAATTAGEQGDGEEQFELRLTAAAILRSAARHEAAMQRFRQLALSQPQHSRAAEAHLLAIASAGQLSRTTGSEQRPERIERYAGLLDEHLRHWPEGESAAPVYLSLGRLRQSQGDLAGAGEAYRRVARESRWSVPALEGMHACYVQQLLSEPGESKRGAAARDAATFFEQLIVGNQRRWPAMWTEAQRAAALAAARLRLRFTDDGAPTAARVLEAALAGQPAPPPDWAAEARLLLSISLAGSGDVDRAAKQLATISDVSVQRQLEALERLLDITADANTNRPAANLAGQLVDRIQAHRNKLNTGQQAGFDLLRARVLMLSKKYAEAVKLYARLAEQAPENAEIQEAWAAALHQAGDYEAAARRWRFIERHSRRGSPRWFRSRYQQADCLLQLGQFEKCAKLIQLTSVLHPDLGGPHFQPRFEALLATCNQRLSGQGNR